MRANVYPFDLMWCIDFRRVPPHLMFWVGYLWVEYLTIRKLSYWYKTTAAAVQQEIWFSKDR